MKHCSIKFLPSIVVSTLLATTLSCGKSSSTNNTSANPTPTPVPTVTEVPESAPVSFWMTSNPKEGGGPVAYRYDGTGRLSLTIDLRESGLDYGPITALHFLDASTLMFFIDPGVDKETIGTFDVKTGLIKNKAWGSETSIKTAFKAARANSFVTGLQNGVLHAQTASGIKAIRYGSDGGLAAEDFYNSTSAAATDCPVGTVTQSKLVQGGGNLSLGVLVSGTATRINILYSQGGEVKCRSSLDYAQGPETTAQHKAVNIEQMPDGKIYVLYQHESTPLVMRYDFDGTSLTNPKKVYSGVSNLGKTPLGLIARTNKRLLIGRPDIGALVEIQLKSTEAAEQTDFYKTTSFAKDLTALVAEPAQ
ncbi:MAG: hypothetical protein RI953_2248 [Pseudomonadota bacterium]|jgi:hypothetical protein